jgi:hypothetical protein
MLSVISFSLTSMREWAFCDPEVAITGGHQKRLRPRAVFEESKRYFGNMGHVVNRQEMWWIKGERYRPMRTPDELEQLTLASRSPVRGVLQQHYPIAAQQHITAIENSSRYGLTLIPRAVMFSLPTYLRRTRLHFIGQAQFHNQLSRIQHGLSADDRLANLAQCQTS